MKRVPFTMAVILGAFATFGSAAQIQGFISGYAPGNVEELKKSKGVETSQDLHSDFMWGLGAEFLANPVGPLVVGGGLGFFSLQQDGDVNVVMPSIPLWASIGVIGPEQWSVRPYLEARVGYPIPATGLSTWWDKPLDFFVTGTVGVQLPYHMGVEFDCTYLTMDKYFKEYDVNFRLSSVKIGGSITVHFDLSGSSAEPAAAPANKSDVVKPSEEFSSAVSSDANENTEPSVSEEQPYSDYGVQPTEEPAEETAVAEEPVAEEAVAEPVAEYGSEESSEEQLVEDAAEPGAGENESSVEETSAYETAETAPEESVAAEEPPAGEPVAEPKPEPAPELSPEPQPEPAAAPAAKKSSSKKSAKNAKAKKGSKKEKKKASAKKSAKKGKAASKKAAKKPAAKKKAAAKKKPKT